MPWENFSNFDRHRLWRGPEASGKNCENFGALLCNARKFSYVQSHPAMAGYRQIRILFYSIWRELRQLLSMTKRSGYSPPTPHQVYSVLQFSFPKKFEGGFTCLRLENTLVFVFKKIVYPFHLMRRSVSRDIFQ